MRILIANEGLSGGGGVETYLSTLVPALQAAGHEVGVLHDNPAGENAPQRIAPEGTWHIGVQDVGLEKAIEGVRTFAPDVCFSHNMRSLEIESRLVGEWPSVKMMHGFFGTCVSGQKAFVFPSMAACTRTFGPGCLGYYLPRRCGQASPIQMLREYRWGSDQRSLFSRYRAIVVAKAHGVRRALPLPVSAPFHCDLMKPAEERLRPMLESAHFKDLWMSLVSNVDASPIGTATAVRNALVRQVASPVRWVESVQKMVAMGVRRFVEIGPGNVLTGLIKRIDTSIELINVSDVPSIEKFVESLQ